MSKEVKPNAEGKDGSVEVKSDNITVGEMLSRRLAEKSPPKKEAAKAAPEPDEEPIEQEPEQKVESTPEQEEESLKAEEVVSKEIDLDSRIVVDK
jgi:hypothetical protein